LSALLNDHGLSVGEIVGLAPRANPLVVLHGFHQARKGRISYGELSRRLKAGQARSMSVSYMGYATRSQRRT
jgi:2-polyprenyl-6-hydroxyphenyl methylase/3-demethylubiquinone-9 3-methyltransferase